VDQYQGFISDASKQLAEASRAQPGDAAALAAELRRLAHAPSLRASLGEAARRRARAFSGEVAAAQALAAYAAVLGSVQPGTDFMPVMP
jgi:glycosyltransferase involved in cell wall biosynthesis